MQPNTEKVTSHFNKDYAHLHAVLTHGPCCLPATVQLMDAENSYYYLLPKSLVEKQNCRTDWPIRTPDKFTDNVRNLMFNCLKLALGFLHYEPRDNWVTAIVTKGTAAGLPLLLIPKLEEAYVEQGNELIPNVKTTGTVL